MVSSQAIIHTCFGAEKLGEPQGSFLRRFFNEEGCVNWKNLVKSYFFVFYLL